MDLSNQLRFFYFKFAFILFLSFPANQKQESGFQQVGGLVTGNNSVFCLQRVTLYLKAKPNSIDFHKGIFLHVLTFSYCSYYSSIVPFTSFVPVGTSYKINFSNVVFGFFSSKVTQYLLKNQYIALVDTPFPFPPVNTMK